MKKLATGAITTGTGTLMYPVPTGMRTEVKDLLRTFLAMRYGWECDS